MKQSVNGKRTVVRTVGFALVIGATLASVLAGCSTDSSKPASSGKPNLSSYSVAWDSPNTGDDFYISVECAFKPLAKAAGLNVKYYGSTPFSAQTQLPVLNTIAATSPNGLLLSTSDTSALDAPLTQMKGAGTKIINFDNAPTDTSLWDGFVKANHAGGGAMVADEINTLLKGKGTVLPIDLRPGVQAVNARTTGFLAEMKKYPGIKVLPTQYDQEQVTTDQSIINSTLAAHPDLSAIAAMYDTPAEGAVSTLKDDGKIGTVKIVSIDPTPPVISFLKEGDIQAVMDMSPTTEAKESLAMMIKALEGKPIDPKQEQFSMVKVTKDNVDDPSIIPGLWVSSCNN